MSALSDRPANPAVGEAIPHGDAFGHVTGTALYTDDLVGRMHDLLHAYPVSAPHAHAKIIRLETAPAYTVPGVVRVLTAHDVPGVNDSNVNHDEPLFPDEVMFYGHPVCWVLGDTLEAARLGAEAVEVDYEKLPSIVTIPEAIAAESFQGRAPTVTRGDADAAMSSAAHVFSGTWEASGQEQFYLETQASIAYVDEGGQVFIHSSTQNPTETQEITAHVLGLSSSEVTVQCLRMGGGFGGKETQANGYAAIAALGATLTGRPVRVRLNRNQDIQFTGKRPDFLSTWEAGFDDEGHILALKVVFTADGGWSMDLSQPVLSRALCHVDNAYWIPNIHAHGRIAKTNRTSHTAFRGFGGPQGMLLTENILGTVAPKLGLTGEQIRERNFYTSEDQTTPYGQHIRHVERLHEVWGQVLAESDFAQREREIEQFNATHEHVKRAIAATPVKFGISFNQSSMNQGGALVLVYKDGSVLVNHGGTEMGQGLHTKMLQVAATALGLPLTKVRLAPTRTDKVPNTSATSASTGADLNGGAVKHACDQIRDRLAVVAGGLLGVPPADVRFGDATAYGLNSSREPIPWDDLVRTAYLQRIQLHAAGYYRTEGLVWNEQTYQGSPFKYFSYGSAVAEVEVDGFTGAYRTLRVDVVHDVGDSLSPLIDQGQIEGAFVQGAGWLTLEDQRWDASDQASRGRFSTQAASTYKLPSFSEMPEVFNVTMSQHPEEGVIYGGKAVGEPPLMLPFSVREALRKAAAAFGPAGTSVHLASPATPEAVYWALESARATTPESPVPAGISYTAVERRRDPVPSGV